MLKDHKSNLSSLHEDLWEGNYRFLQDGRSALFAPSPFYGDRASNLEITAVFGGFSTEFYEVYNQLYPLAPRWKERLEFYRLYLLMVHLNKFSFSYYPSVINLLKNIRQSLPKT